MRQAGHKPGHRFPLSTGVDMAEQHNLPEPDDAEVRPLDEPAPGDRNALDEDDRDYHTLDADAEVEDAAEATPEPPRATPKASTAVAIELPPTGHELLSFAGQLERLRERCKKSEEPHFGAYGAVTQSLNNAVSNLRSAIGFTL